MEKEISNAASVDALAPMEGIKELIYTVRGVQVMLDRDLARLYQAETRVLNQAVKRNIQRFPERFMFQLTENEAETLLCSRSQFVTLNEDVDMPSQFVTRSGQANLKSQSVTSSVKRGQNFKYLPYVFTEQGMTQLSAVLRSDVAVEMSIRINDAFHAMRHFLVANACVFQRLEQETVWQTQAQMAELFKSTKQIISLHINNVFKEGELTRASTVMDFLPVQTEGGSGLPKFVLHLLKLLL